MKIHKSSIKIKRMLSLFILKKNEHETSDNISIKERKRREKIHMNPAPKLKTENYLLQILGQHIMFKYLAYMAWNI